MNKVCDVSKYLSREEVFVDKEDFKREWISVLEKFEKQNCFGVYIANPFCIRKCKFCIYNSTITKIGSPEYENYYRVFLPAVINYFNELFEIKIPDAIYFGGGTVNVMNTDILENICNSITNFSKIPSKSIELNPLLLNDQMIKEIARKNFTYVSFGVQTYDERILSKHTRANPEINRLASYIEFFKKNNISVNCDLMAFLDTGNEEDLVFLKKDINRLIEEANPDSITIYPMYQRFSGQKSDFLLVKNISRFRALRKLMIEIEKTTDYKECFEDLTKLDDRSLIAHSITNYKLVRDGLKKKILRDGRYNSNADPAQATGKDYNLGIGGFGNHIPYSYFGKEGFYKMYNVNNEDILISKSLRF